MTHEACNSNTQIAFTPKAHKRIIQIKPDTRQHLSGFTLLDRRLPQTFTQTPKKQRKKGSRDFPFVAGESSPPTVSVVPPGPDSFRGRRTLSGTSRPDARVLCMTGAAASPDRASSGSAARQVDHSLPLSTRLLLCPSATTNHSTTLSLLLSTLLLCPSTTH